MSAFASHGFNSEAYLALRPTYNRSMVRWLLDYHQGSHDCALDVACGPGTFTVDLAPHFDRVVGIDPSPNMIDSAKNDAQSKCVKNIDYKQGSAESLPIDSDSVDLLTVMQGAHWFKINDFLSEALRVLRPGGTLAMVGYGYAEAANWPESANGRTFARDLAIHKEKLEPYWSEGFTLIEDAYKPLYEATSATSKFENVEYLCYPKETAANSKIAIVLPETWIDSKSMFVDGFRASLKTWSAYKSWKDVHQHDVDIIDAYFDKHQEEFGIQGDDDVVIEWPQFAVVARKPL
ncbi:trans-aconitate methyltransferase 1 [Coemansia sp. Benny D115]|nr:trans-aconitate methyltransferase 1 [Coemansia sp. Benny D115]